MSFIDEKLGIKTTRYHKQFILKRDSKNNIIQGKKDLFAVLISMKLLLNQEKFQYLIKNLIDLINDYSKQINSLTRNQLLSIMHFPENFEKIANL